MQSTNHDKKRVFITAAGHAERWNGECKQLAVIEGEPLIRRTIRMVHEIDPSIKVYVVSYRPELKFYDCEYIDTKKPTKSLSCTLKMTVPYWTDYNYFLMGDAIFTKEVLLDILLTRKRAFFGNLNNFKGRHPERVAAVVPIEDREFAIAGLNTCLEHRLKNELPCFATPYDWMWVASLLNRPGVLGFLYWHCFLFLEDFIWKSPGITIIDDQRVADIDTPEDYQDYLNLFYHGKSS